MFEYAAFPALLFLAFHPPRRFNQSFLWFDAQQFRVPPTKISISTNNPQSTKIWIDGDYYDLESMIWGNLQKSNWIIGRTANNKNLNVTSIYRMHLQMFTECSS